MACLNGMRTGEQQQGSKFGRWLKGKLNAITHKEKLPKSSESLRQHGGARPLTDGASKSHARRKAKQQQAVTVSQHSANDDCSQVSSDQLSLVLSQQHSSRVDEHVQSEHPHESAVDGSPQATANAATQLSALRELLVTHIRQATPTGNPAPSSSGMPPLRSPRAAAGLTAKQALAADHMQLLDLVEVLITDHKTSLLERKRLQQQLDATQHALQGEWLDRERAAALADVRSEEAQQAQEHLASTAALTQQLHNRRVISSTRIKLPPASGQQGPRRHSTGEEQTVQCKDSSPELYSQPSQQQQYRRQSEPCSSRLAPAQSNAAGAGLAAERSRGSSVGGQSCRSVTPPVKAAAGKATGSTPFRAARASAFSLRSGSKAVAAAGAGAGTGKGPASRGVTATAGGKERRLFGRPAAAASTGLPETTHQQYQQANRAGAHDKQLHAEQEQALKRSRWGGLQPHGPAQPPAAHADAEEHAQALKRMLAGEDRTVLDAAPRQSSIDTQASSLAMSADAETMLGLTKGQLHKVLQRPWLQDMQEPADTASAALDSSRQHGHSSHAATCAAHRAATSAGQSQQESSAGSLAAENSPSDAQSLNAVIQSRSSGNGSVYASQMHPQLAALAADSSSSASACAHAGDTGSSAAQAQQKGRLNTAAHSSHGSWPGMKVSTAGNSQAGAAMLQPPARPSPQKQRSNANRLRGRSRAQPQQLSTSLESAATLPLQVTGGPGNERGSHSSSVAEGAGQEGAPGWGHNSLEMVQEEQQHWQQQQPAASAGASTSNLGSDHSGMSQAQRHVLSRDDSSGHDIAAEHSGSQQAAGKQRRRWAAPSPVSQAEQLKAHTQKHQQQAEQQAHKQHSHQHDVRQQEQRHKLSGPPAPAEAANAAAPSAPTGPGATGNPHMLSKKHLQALAASTSMHSSGELSGGTSDLACMSITSAATGCTTLSGLAGVYLQHPSKPTKVCPRPSFVPKLELQGIAGDPAAAAVVQQTPQPQQQAQQQKPAQQQQQQQALQAKSKQVTPRAMQQQGQQLARTSTPAASGAAGSQQEQRGQQLTPCSSTEHHLGSARSYLTAEELADIAPLMAHASSRRQSAPAAVSPEAGAAAASPAHAASRPASDCAGRVSSSGGGGSTAAGAPAGGVCPAPRCTPRASRSSTGSISSGGSGPVTSGGTAAGAQREHNSGGHTATAADPAGAGASTGPSAHRPTRAGGLAAGAEASSNTVHRTSGGGGISIRAYRPSSGGGSTGLPAPGGVGYWGSSTGSYPASENPSRQPTPRVSDAAAGAGSTGGAERRASRSRPSTAGNIAQGATNTGGAASSANPAGAGQHSSSTAGAAGAGAGHAGHGTGVVLTAIPQPCAASATAAAATSFMTMRPAHLYRSVSTVYAMYSPLMGNLRALGHSRAASHLSTVTTSHAHHHAAAVAGTDPAAAAAHGRQPAATAHASSHMRPEVPTFAGLASMTTTTLVEPHAGTDMAAAVAAAAAAAHEYHWQALLGGCPPVPEDTSLQGQEGQQQAGATGTAAADGGQQVLEGAVAAGEGEMQRPASVVAADGAAAAAAAASSSAKLSSRGQHSQGQAAAAATQPEMDRREAAQIPRAGVTAAAAAAAAAAAIAAGPQPQPQPAAAAAPAAIAAAAQPHSSRLHQRTQPLQVQVPEVLERDVIERGPVLPPASLSGAPVALSPHRQRLGSPRRLMSPLAAAAAAVAREVGETGASSPLLAAAEAGAPVGPLMMSSPTRLQWQRGQGRTHAHSSHNHGHGHGHSQHSRSAAGAAAPRQQHRQQQQQQQQQQPPRHRSRPMSPGRAAAIEAAAASVAAHVAAAAQLIHRQEKRISNSQLLLQPEAPAGAQPVPQPQQQLLQEPAQMIGITAAPLRRQQSQGVQVAMNLQLLPQQQQEQQQEQQQQQQPTRTHQQQQPGTLELDCSLCCFSPTSAAGDDGGAWIQEASPNALVAAASATVDSLMQQAERLGMQCLSHRTTQQQQHGVPQGFSHSSFEARLHSHSSSDLGRLSSTSSMVLAQQQLQQLMPPPPARPAREGKAQHTPSSHKKRRSRSRWHTQQQQQQHNNPLYQLQLGEEAASVEPQQQQLPYFEQRTPPRSSRSRSSSRRSSSHHQHSAVKPPSAYRTVRTPPMSPGAAALAALDAPEELIVRTYQNTLLALEAAVEAAGLPGLGSSMDAELVSVALLPGLLEQLAQQASEASSYGGAGGFGLPGGACGCDAAAGVSAAAVPVHMTPLAKDRSLRRVGSQQGLGLSREGSGAGGQLHWNPLFRTGEDVPLEASYN